MVTIGQHGKVIHVSVENESREVVASLYVLPNGNLHEDSWFRCDVVNANRDTANLKE